MKDTSKPAFPVPESNRVSYEGPPITGMTLRQWYAGMVLQSACEDFEPEFAAKIAFEYADAMLKEGGE